MALNENIGNVGCLKFIFNHQISVIHILRMAPSLVVIDEQDQYLSEGLGGCNSMI